MAEKQKAPVAADWKQQFDAADKAVEDYKRETKSIAAKRREGLRRLQAKRDRLEVLWKAALWDEEHARK